MSPRSTMRLAAALFFAAVVASVSALPGADINAEETGSEGKRRLQCLICRNCRMFEVDIHSNDCEADATHCMKVDLHSGEVERSCATEEKCRKATANADVEGGRRSSQGITKVGCCTEDLCNAATTLGGIGPAAATAFGICSALLFAHLGGNMG